MGKGFYARLKFRACSCPWIGQVPRKFVLHIFHAKTHRVPFRVQQDFEVTILTNKRKETDAILHKPETKIKMRTTNKQQETACETTWSGWRTPKKTRGYRSARIRKHLETIIDTQLWCKPDLAAQWTQSHPCKTQTSQETEKRLRKFLDPSDKAESHVH